MSMDGAGGAADTEGLLLWMERAELLSATDGVGRVLTKRAELRVRMGPVELQ
jgi:hypothetical protein